MLVGIPVKYFKRVFGISDGIQGSDGLDSMIGHQAVNGLQVQLIVILLEDLLKFAGLFFARFTARCFPFQLGEMIPQGLVVQIRCIRLLYVGGIHQQVNTGIRRCART